MARTEQTRPLRGHVSVVLDASGAGQVSFGPDRHGVQWDITRVAVQTSTSTLVPEARVYRDSVGDATFLSGTFVGSFDSDDSVNETLYQGERMFVTWSGGDVGATATATYYGNEISWAGG